jgi:NADPH:quinone reductase-like Zn-dependent oxidoreductase
MKKIVIRRPGSYSRLRFEEHPTPAPSPNQVLIATRAIGINYADVVIRMGLYESARKSVGYPITPGFEVSGVVEAVGEGVDDLSVGDRVIAVTRFGGYASHVLVPRAQVFRMPKQLRFEQAAALPVVFLTAYYALCELARPRIGNTLLVHSAAGGVGGMLVRLGKHAGCYVVGVVGAMHKVSVARSLGADEVIDKSREPLWTRAEQCRPEGYDVVFDANGVSTLKESYQHVRPTGRLVIYGFASMLPRKGGRPNWPKLASDYVRTPRFNPLDMTNTNRSVMAFNLSYLFAEEMMLVDAMQKLFLWLDEGIVTPPGISRYAFDDVARAHRDIESAQTTGKLVLII